MSPYYKIYLRQIEYLFTIAEEIDVLFKKDGRPLIFPSDPEGGLRVKVLLEIKKAILELVEEINFIAER